MRDVQPSSAVSGESTTEATFALAAGTWDWARGDSTCMGNTQYLAISPDRRTMSLAFKAPIESATGRRVVLYRILAAGNGILAQAPFVIRAAMDEETRRTDAGVLVQWDLVLVTRNRYHWHRSDWPNHGLTHALVRCDGTRPLEEWRPAASTTPRA